MSVPLWRLLGVAALVSRDALSTREGADGSVYGHTTPYYDEFGRLVLSETSATLPASHPTGYEFGGDSNGAQAFTQGSQLVESSSSYDAWGNAEASCAGANLASGTSGCLRNGEVDYDTDYDMFPTSERIARDGTGGAFTYLETSGVWDRGLGVLTSMADPTGESTSVGYDGFGRLTQVTPPPAEGCSAMPVQRFVYDLAPGGAPISVVTTYAEQDCAAIGADQIETRTYVDGLGRTRASLSPASAADPGAWIQSGITILNQRGTVKRAYQPEWVMESDPSIARALRIPSTPYEWAGYDSFDRPRCATSACGQMSCTTYHALTVDECDHLDMSSDPVHAGTCTTTRTDGHGRTVDQVLRNRQVPHGPIEYYRLWSDYRADGAVTLLTRAETTTDGLRGTAPVVTGHQVQRTFTYDSVGRRIGTTDPDSDSLDAACTSRNCTWRYLFSEVGDLVAVRDPRGCGQNFYYDRLGRLIGEDYVECGESQGSAEISSETVPATAVAMEELAAAHTVDVRYHYETAPGWAGYTQVTANPSRYRGRLVAVADRGQRSAMAYDRRGNATWSVREMAVIPDAGSTTLINANPGDGLPPTVSNTPAAPTTREYDTAHPYVRTASFDHAGRPTSMTLPSDPDWTGTGLAPEIGGTIAYDERGLPSKVELTVDNAPRTIVESIRYSEHGLVERVQYGDDDGRAPTVSTTTYDACMRPREFETNRAPTAGTGTDLALVTTPMHQRLTWDEANNLVRIEDLRDASEWPDGYRPQTVDVFHDALYRVVNAHYTYAGGTAGGDAASNWRSDMATHRADDPMRTTPAPMAAALPPERVRSLTWQYDWLGNMQEWTDDAHAFYERSLGDIENGADRAAHERPAALHLATDIRQSSVAPTSIDVGEDRGGWVELTYGQSGNVVEMTVHGQCRDPDASSACWDDLDLEGAARASHLRASCFCATEQHYAYRWDELNRLAEARRYDRMGGSTGSWVAAVRQRYRYDSANQRTVKQTLDGDAEPERIALYVFPGDFERRGLVHGAFGDEYEASTGLDTETQYLVGGARVVWKTRAGVAGLDADQRVTVALTDLIQTTAAVLDLESGELLEASTYYPNGARETYRVQALEGIAAEPSGFTGKEADEEVGLVYFGERYLIPRVGRWASPDPLHVHAVGGGEALNSYHYVGGNMMAARDPQGLALRAVVYESSRPSAGVNIPLEVEHRGGAGQALDAPMRSDPGWKRTEDGYRLLAAMRSALRNDAAFHADRAETAAERDRLLAQGEREAQSLTFDRRTGAFAIDEDSLGAPAQRLGRADSFTLRRFRTAIDSPVDITIGYDDDDGGADIGGSARGRTTPVLHGQINIVLDDEHYELLEETYGYLQGPAIGAGIAAGEAAEDLAHEIGLHAARQVAGMIWGHQGTRHVPGRSRRWDRNPDPSTWVRDNEVDAESHFVDEMNSYDRSHIDRPHPDDPPH